jgi:voltage-gated potassium channel
MPQRPLGRRLQRRVERKGLRPRYAAYVIIAFWAVGVIVFGIVERLVDPDTFGNIWLGMWWAIQTVTTVGYGDIVPVTRTGRFAGMVIMFTGVAVLGVLAGSLSSLFGTDSPDEEPDASDRSVHAELAALERELQEMHTRVGALAARAQTEARA